MTTKYLIVDIRNSDEVLSKHFDGSKITNFYNIPMNMIRFNKEGILSHLKYIDKIFIVCQSGSRAQFIKNKYFKEENNILVDKSLQFKNMNTPGMHNITLESGTTIPVYINGSFKYNLYNLTRIIQIILGSVILACVLLLWKTCRMKTPLIVLVLFGGMALFNGLTNTCTLSLVFRDLLN